MKNSRPSALALALSFVFCHNVIDTAVADPRVLRAPDGTTHYSDRLAPSLGTPVALASDRDAITPGVVGGRWIAHSDDGFMTMLELRPAGGFIYDQQAQRTPERAYMCGDWTLEGGALSLRAKTRKTRDAAGVIELHEAETRQTFTVLAAHSDVLVLRADDARTLTFYRRGA